MHPTVRMVLDYATTAKLTPSQTRDTTAAELQRNAQNCENGWDECDHSKLTPLQAKQTAYSEHQRNLSACKDGEATCDYAKLTAHRSEDTG